MGAFSPEVIYCQMAEQIYEEIVATIKTALSIPQLAYRSFISILKRIFSVIYAAIETAIVIIEQQVLSILNVDALDLLDIKANFCEVLSQCEALIDFILAPDSTLLGLTDAQKIAARESFENFEELVCRTSLRSLLENYTDELLDRISEQLDALEQQLLDQDIFQLIEEYLEELRNLGILDLFDTLDPFFQCAFALCNFAVAGTRQKEEFQDLLQVQKTSGRYFLTVDPFVESIVEKDNDLKQRIANLRREILSKQPPRGVPVDETLS
jgi:HPt (histidine-containing phosphotransfer) domain-containing protein